MLELHNIKKTYHVGDLKVEAVKGVSLSFRKNEFVSILGQSGCGKTTLLNIIGGLDRYTSGDLIINNKSTKKYKDKDWDNYRNHSIGFVFQSYNLIPHQTVLENVELALTLSGVSKNERKKRAVAVLNKVGLGDKLKNKPNQLSGGQMQRVAIARALVNDPEIILADEPTGALDSATSTQVMNLLKEISKDKLIIMVTHNAEMAYEYSSRIVKLSDGVVVDDSNPITDNENVEDSKVLSVSEDKDLSKVELKRKNRKKRMSFFTALSLSFKNLLTKKTRTILVAFAGSIGIIGIALVLAISSGFNTYINKMQEDTLSTYPVTIKTKNIDFSSLITSMFLTKNQSEDVNHEKDAIYSKNNITNVINNVGQNLDANNLEKFYAYINEHKSELESYVNAIQYTYDIDLEFYQVNATNIEPNSSAIMNMIMSYAVHYFNHETNTTYEKITNGQYKILKKENESINYSFIDSYVELAYIKTDLQTQGYTLLNANQVLNLTFTILGVNMSQMTGSNSLSSSFSQMSIFSEMIDNLALIKEQYDLVGENSKWAENANECLLVLDKNNELDDYVLYALGFYTDEQMSNLMKSSVYGTEFDSKIDYSSIIGKEFCVITDSDYYVEDDGEIVDYRLFGQEKINNEANEKYNLVKYYTYQSQMQNKIKNSANKLTISGIVRLKENADAGSLSAGIAYTSSFTNQMISYQNESLACENNKLTKINKTIPSTINIYVSTFESKDSLKEFIKTYNAQATKEEQITYTDYIDLIMSTVSVIINAISYVLIAFVSVSLIVSSIMIGIITYISVIERTKEIGVLRSIGASKKDIKRVFTAESFIIGLTSGGLGIAISYLLIWPINLILKSFTNIAGLASLPILGSIILVIISIALTFIAGLIPANMAAKKDPVIALRTE